MLEWEDEPPPPLPPVMRLSKCSKVQYATRVALPLSSELSTHKTVKARIWRWLEPSVKHKPGKPYKLFPSRSAVTKN